MTPDRHEEARELASLHPDVKLGSSVGNPTGARCKNCQKVIADPDAPTGFCCMQCGQNDSQDLSQAKLREIVTARDQGRCALCRIDCIELRKEIDTLKTCADNSAPNDPRARHFYEARIHQLVRLGFDRHAVESGASLFEIDHTTPRAAGGVSRPEACRTLCVSCHHRMTGKFAKDRAAARKPRGGRR